MDAEARLVKACEIGQRTSVQNLLHKISQQAIRERKPILLKAIEGRHCELVSILLQNGADPNVCDALGESPLHIALRTHQNEAAKAILLYGVDVNKPNYHGLLPLHQAISQRNHDLVSKLVLKGANVNLKNAAGLTPFMLACKTKSTSLALTLIKNGADLDIKDNKGWSALEYAILAGMYKSLKRLRQAGLGSCSVHDDNSSTESSCMCKVCNRTICKAKTPSEEDLLGSFQSLPSVVETVGEATRELANELSERHDEDCQVHKDRMTKAPYEKHLETHDAKVAKEQTTKRSLEDKEKPKSLLATHKNSLGKLRVHI